MVICLHFLQFSTDQDSIYALEEAHMRPPRLSDVSPTLPLKQFPVYFFRVLFKYEMKLVVSSESDFCDLNLLRFDVTFVRTKQRERALITSNQERICFCHCQK